MNLIFIDFETMFDQEYSLRRMTTEQYVRDGRFKAHGAAIRWPDGRIVWYTGRDLPAVFAQVDWSKTAVCAHHLHFDGYILSHHYGVHPAQLFCTLAMANIMLPHQRKSLDAITKHFGFPEKNVPYNLFRGIRDLPPHIEHQVAEGCRHDVWLNHAIFKRFIEGDPARNLPPFPRGELEPISITLKMFTEPSLCIDIPRAEALAGRIQARKAAALLALAGGWLPYIDDSIAAARAKTLDEDECKIWLGLAKKYPMLGVRALTDPEKVDVLRRALRSRELFADMLRALQIEPPTKPAKKPNAAGVIEQTYAFAKSDRGMKDMLESGDDTLVALCEAKLGEASMINETRAMRFAGSARRGQPVPVYLNYNSTFSGRTGGGDKSNWSNLERLPNIDDKTGTYEAGPDGHPRKGELRLCIKAQPGHKLVVVDLSQIEARVLAYNARQNDLVEDFRNKVDPYSSFIEPYYGYPISKKTPSERGVGKQLRLSCGFMAGANTIKVTAALGSYGPPVILTDPESEALKQFYRKRSPMIVNYWDEADQAIQALVTGRDLRWGPVQIHDHRMFLPNGSWLDYTTLHQVSARPEDPAWKHRKPQWAMKTKTGIERVHKGVVTAHITSSLARVIMTDALKVVAQRYRVALTCYDELVVHARAEEAEEAARWTTAVMERDVWWAPGLPVASEYGIDDVYSK